MSTHLFKRASKQSLDYEMERPRSYQHALSWLTWWAAFALATLIGFSRLSYGLLLPALHADLGGSLSVLGTLATINFVGYLLGMLVMPLLLARIHHRARLNLLALLMTNLLMIVSASSLTIWQLGIWRLLIGFFSAIATVLTMALTLERIHPHERGRASGIIWMGAALGIIISGLIAPPIIGMGTHGGWRLVWIVMGLAGVIIAFGFFVTGRAQKAPLPSRVSAEASPTQQALWVTLRPLLLPRRLLWLSLTYFGFGGGYIMYLTFFITFLEKQGIPTLYAGFVWAAVGITAALSAWIWGRIFDHWPTGFTVAVALAFGACGSLAVLTNRPVVEYIGAAIVGLSALTAPPIIITVLLKRAVPDAAYAVSYSTLTAIFAIGQILGPLLGGLVIEQRGLEAGIATSALLLGGATLCACGYGLVQRKN